MGVLELYLATIRWQGRTMDEAPSSHERQCREVRQSLNVDHVRRCLRGLSSRWLRRDWLYVGRWLGGYRPGRHPRRPSRGALVVLRRDESERHRPEGVRPFASYWR